LRVFGDVDVAREWCEDQLLADMLKRDVEPKFALSELDVFKGLSAEECRLVETIVRPLLFDKGEVIIREGEQAELFFVLVRGSVSVQIRVPTQTGEKRRRVASLGPGLPSAKWPCSAVARARPTLSPTRRSSATGSRSNSSTSLLPRTPTS
jgi:glutaminase